MIEIFCLRDRCLVSGWKKLWGNWVIRWIFFGWGKKCCFGINFSFFCRCLIIDFVLRIGGNWVMRGLFL